MINLVEIGRNISIMRKARGFSQMQAALNSGISINRWQDIEYGCGNTTTDTLCRIAKTLGVSPLVLGILSKSDEEILSLIRSAPRLPLINNKPDQLGNNIFFLRKARGLSQKKLAHMAHVSVARLRDIEHGCANVTVLLLDRIADSLGLSLFALATLAMEEEVILPLVYEARTAAEMAGT